MSRPAADTRLIIARPATAGRSPRTTWVWLPVQKNARATPCRRWAATNGTQAVLSAAAAVETPRTMVEARMKVQSGKRFIQLPMPMRASIWVSALSATSTPTWTPLYPASRARSGRATLAMPSATDQTTAAVAQATVSRDGRVIGLLAADGAMV
jgi:hypothetical protein